jgi:hypothetical protein
MNTLKQYQEKNKLSTEELSKLITEKLGRRISVTGVEMMLNRQEAPIPWLNALGISPKEPSGLKDEPKKTEKIEPGVNPAVISLPFEPVSAKQTIELIYSMAGKGAAMATRTPEVANAWHNSGPSLADAWIEWAKENRTVANGIAMLTVGGPGGAVILMNASLIISTLMLIQQKRGVQIIPPRFDAYQGADDDEIRAQTEGQVDEQLRGSPPPG